MDRDTVSDIAHDYQTNTMGLCDMVEACLDLVDAEMGAISAASIIFGPTYWALQLTHKMLIRLLKKLVAMDAKKPADACDINERLDG